MERILQELHGQSFATFGKTVSISELSFPKQTFRSPLRNPLYNDVQRGVLQNVSGGKINAG